MTQKERDRLLKLIDISERYMSDRYGATGYAVFSRDLKRFISEEHKKSNNVYNNYHGKYMTAKSAVELHEMHGAHIILASFFAQDDVQTINKAWMDAMKEKGWSGSNET